jgi:hypothetical protein
VRALLLVVQWGAELVPLLPLMMTGVNMKRLLFIWNSLARMGLLAMHMGTELLLGTLSISTNINTSIINKLTVPFIR